MERSSRQKINKETQALNNTLDQMNLIDIYRAFHPKAAEHIFFSSAHGTFSSIDHMLGHIQASVNLRKLKSYQAIFPSRAMRLAVNYKKKKNFKKHKHVETKQYATKQPIFHCRNQRGNQIIPRDK